LTKYEANNFDVKDLSEAQAELSNIDVHPVGVQIMALKAVHRLVKFESVDPKTANIVKQEMLSHGGEVAVAGTVGKFEEKKTDMIIMGTLAQYVRLVRKLRRQSYGDCLEIARGLADLLFKDFDVESASVW
jgi:dihydropteroate synthase